MAQIASIYLHALGSLRWSKGHNRNSEIGTRDIIMTLSRSLFSKGSPGSKREKQIKCIMVILLSICITFYELAISVLFLSVPGGLVEKQKRQV